MVNEFRGEYYFLSNFFSVPVTYEGITYQNNEAAFQAQKSTDKLIRATFSMLDPSCAKRKGRHVLLRNEWEEIKFDIMYKICLAKFSQNNDLKEKLIATGDEQLVEGNTWGDKIWGTVNGKGKNNLGKILMRVREKLKYDTKTDMSHTCGFKYDEYWVRANLKRTMSQEDWKKWYAENCGRCQHMSEICMYGEDS